MTNFKIFFFIILCIPTSLFSQEYEIEDIVVDDEEIVDVPFSVVEKAPLYPGCIGENNRELKKCTSNSISSFVKEKLNKKKLLKNLKPDSYKTYANFRINEKGEIENITMRTPDNIIEQEVTKAIKKIPTLTPGQQRGKVMGVTYSFAIKFKIDESQNLSFF